MEEDLTGIDVADSGDDPLIHDDLLDGGLSVAECFAQMLPRKVSLQRLWPESSQLGNLFEARRGIELDVPKGPRIDIMQL